MRIILGINNATLEERLYLRFSDLNDIICVKTKEEIISAVNSESAEETVIVLREDFASHVSTIELVDKVKKICPKSRFVLIVRRLSDEFKALLFSKEIFNIIEGESITFEDIILSIENPRVITYTSAVKENGAKIIFVTGSHASGKTTLCMTLSQEISKNKEKKVLVIDLDYAYPSIDLYLDGVSKNYSLQDLLRDAAKHEFKKNTSYETGRKNIRYILNSKQIEMPKDEEVLFALEYLSSFYDYIIVDTSSYYINSVFSIANSLKAYVCITIGMNLESIRKFKIDFRYIAKSELSKALLIVCLYSRKKGLEEYIRKHIQIPILGRITNTKKYDLYKVLKTVGIIKFENIKKKLVEKIMSIGEERK